MQIMSGSGESHSTTLSEGEGMSRALRYDPISRPYSSTIYPRLPQITVLMKTHFVHPCSRQTKNLMKILFVHQAR